MDQNIVNAFLSGEGARRASGGLSGGAQSVQGSTGQIKVSVTGTAPSSPAIYDQANFFDYPVLPVISTLYALATVVPAVPNYANLEIATTLLANPAQLRNINVTQADSAGTIASMIVRPTRSSAFGENANTEINASTFQTAQDFQSTRVQIPLDLVCDGATSVVIVSDANATPASYKATFTFGLGPQRALEVPNYGAAVVKSPGA